MTPEATSLSEVGVMAMERGDLAKARKVFEDHVADLRFEHELINRKITWLLTSQTILFAALGLMLQAAVLSMVRIMAWIGLVISAVIFFGLVGNVIAKRCVHIDYNDFAKARTQSEIWGKRKANGGVEFGVRSFTTWWGIVADLLVPIAFAGAWVVVLVNAADIVTAATPRGR